jgi:ubiquinone/menaquinone biosynthesis C-methylase UbiE
VVATRSELAPPPKKSVAMSSDGVSTSRKKLQDYVGSSKKIPYVKDMKDESTRIFQRVASLAGLKRHGGINQYFRNQIFFRVEIKDKKVADIGGGNGLASFWCVLEGGCSEAVIIDTLDAGSNQKMFDQYNKMKHESAITNKIRFFNGSIQELSPSNQLFDVVLMHNSINHISEAMTPKLRVSGEAKDYFRKQFREIYNFLSPSGRFIVADCSRRNFFGDLGIKNPIAPSINWEVHQTPDVWKELIESSGFKHLRTTWTTRREFGALGYSLFGNKLCSYFLASHFCLEFERVKQRDL